MRRTIEIPDTTICVFFNYVVETSEGMIMATRQMNGDELQSGKVIVCDIESPTEKGGAE